MKATLSLLVSRRSPGGTKEGDQRRGTMKDHLRFWRFGCTAYSAWHVRIQLWTILPTHHLPFYLHSALSRPSPALPGPPRSTEYHPARPRLERPPISSQAPPQLRVPAGSHDVTPKGNAGTKKKKCLHRKRQACMANLPSPPCLHFIPGRPGGQGGVSSFPGKECQPWGPGPEAAGA